MLQSLSEKFLHPFLLFLPSGLPCLSTAAAEEADMKRDTLLSDLSPQQTSESVCVCLSELRESVAPCFFSNIIPFLLTVVHVSRALPRPISEEL